MSHNTINIQTKSPNVDGSITGTMEQAPELGQVLTNANGQQGSGTGNYTQGDNYLFLTGSDSYTGTGVSVSGDTISLSAGVFMIFCVPTWGPCSSTLGDTEIRMQFQDVSGEGLGNIGVSNRHSKYATYPAANIYSAYVEGPKDVVLKVISIKNASSNWPKNNTENSNSRMFLEITRVH